MTIDESCGAIIARMLGGIMLHAQMFNYFDFLGLKGYAKCQKYHYFDESKHYIDMCQFFIEHCNKIPNEKTIENKNIIPGDWYRFTRFDVEAGIRKTSVKAGMDKWVQWERETKALFEQHYQDLINLNEIAIAEKIGECIKHVSEELAHAEEKLLMLKAIDFNISDIMTEQEEVYQKYKKKMKEIKWYD